MRIGIDIDGVLTHLEQFYIDYASKFCGENDIEYCFGNYGYSVSETLGISALDEKNFWNQYLDFYAREEKARPFSSEIIKKLKDEGNEIYIITARWGTNREDEIGKRMRKIVKNWLVENEIVYDQLIFSKAENEKKVQEILDYKIDVMIEDSPKNIEQLSTFIPIICYHAAYNKDCYGKNIIRCYSWYDVYLSIKNMEFKNICDTRKNQEEKSSKKSIAIFGSSRAGKSTLSKMIAKKFPNYHIIIGDDIRSAFGKVLPNTNINSQGGIGMVDDFPRFLSTLFYKNIKRNKGEFHYIVETCDMTPRKAKELFDNENTILLFVGQAKQTPQEHFDEIRKYETESDWTYHCSDEHMMKHSEEWVTTSKQYEKECKELGIWYVDTSSHRNEVLSDTLNKIEKIILGKEQE